MRSAPTHPVDVFLLLADGDALLLALRQGTGYDDGRWNLPSGKLEHGEDAAAAIMREAREEIGLRLTRDAVRLVTTLHHRAADGHTRVGLVFGAAYAPESHGEPVNAEPHKCGGIDWFPAADLPPNMSAYSTDCIAAYRAGDHFRLSGWPG